MTRRSQPPPHPWHCVSSFWCAAGSAVHVLERNSRWNTTDRAIEFDPAIGAAERCTSAEIRVAVARFYHWGDVRRAAQRAFVRLGMHKTKQRNGVLVFVSQWRRRFAVIGDEGADAALPATLWAEVRDRLAQAFRNGDRTGGLVDAVTFLGERLAGPFPFEPGRDSNELVDDVSVQ